MYYVDISTCIYLQYFLLNTFHFFACQDGNYDVCINFIPGKIIACCTHGCNHTCVTEVCTCVVVSYSPPSAGIGPVKDLVNGCHSFSSQWNNVPSCHDGIVHARVACQTLQTQNRVQVNNALCTSERQMRWALVLTQHIFDADELGSPLQLT